MELFIFLGSLFFFMLIGVPLAIVLVLCSIVLMWHSGMWDAMIIPGSMLDGANNYPLMAIPFFVFAGEIMAEGGLSKRVVQLAQLMIGRVRGGLGYAAIIASIIFAGLMGSSVGEAAALMGILYPMMRDAGYDKASAAGLSLLCSFGSCLLALTLDGAVWYQAQLLAYMLTCLALLLMLRDHPTPALFLYALAVGCRPFNVLYGLLLYALYIDKARRDGQAWSTLLHRLILGTLLGLFVAAAYALYNYARFGNPLEFGHNYLPEFSTQGGTQFALWHIPANFKTFVLGLPFSEGMDGWTLNQFGFSFLLASPIFILLLVQCAADLCARRFTLLKGGLMLCFILHLLLLLMHRTFGGYQFGARYTCDMIPYAVLYLCLPGRRRSLRVWEWCLLAAAIGFCVYGTASMAL